MTNKSLNQIKKEIKQLEELKKKQKLEEKLARLRKETGNVRGRKIKKIGKKMGGGLMNLMHNAARNYK